MTAPVDASTRRQALRTIGATLVERLRRAGPVPFGRVFLPHLLYGRPSPLHDDLNAWHVRELDAAPGALDAYAAPRGHGKSTAGVEVPALWHVAYCVRRYVVIASDTWSQAIKRLETVRTEIENNPELRAAFPNLRPARDLLGNVVAWRDDEIALACGCRIIAVGAGKSIRGAKASEHRPDLLLLDDLEDDASVATPGALEKRLRWITRTALALAGPMRGISALWVGTILSRAALLNLATGAAFDEGQVRPEWARAWTPHVYRAELDGERLPVEVVDPESGETVRRDDGTPLTYDVGPPLWSELTREDLAGIRFRVGPIAYAAEYLSDPVDDATKLLAPPRRAVWANPGATPLGRVVVLPDGQVIPVASMTRAVALDPQYAEATSKSDPDLAAIAVVGQYGSRTFLLDAWIGRDRHGQAARLVDLATKWACYAAGVETVAAQVATADAAAALARVPIVRMKPTEGKVERALSLSVRLGDREHPETCRVFVLPEAEPVVEYLEAFPHGRYDDPVDAVVMALDLATRAAPAEGGGAPSLGGGRST